MGLHHTLGKAGRPRREQDVAKGRRAPPRPMRRSTSAIGGLGGTGQELVPPHRPLRRQAPRDHGGLQVRKFDPGVPQHRHVVGAEKIGHRHQDLGPAAAQDVGSLRTLEPRVDGDEHRPGPEGPSAATIHSALLKAQMETRSPGSMPEATRAARKAGPVRPARCSSSGCTIDDAGPVAEAVGRGVDIEGWCPPAGRRWSPPDGTSTATARVEPPGPGSLSRCPVLKGPPLRYDMGCFEGRVPLRAGARHHRPGTRPERRRSRRDVQQTARRVRTISWPRAMLVTPWRELVLAARG